MCDINETVIILKFTIYINPVSGSTCKFELIVFPANFSANRYLICAINITLRIIVNFVAGTSKTPRRKKTAIIIPGNSSISSHLLALIKGAELCKEREQESTESKR